MSFIEQSQQIQRSQRTQSPTTNILQAGSNCGCNSGSHSLIAQSQKVGCGCTEGTSNTFDRTDEDSNPPVPAMHSGDDCIWVFSHIETEVVPDTPLQDNPDIIKLIYKRDCSKRRDGGTDPGGRGGGGDGKINEGTNIFGNSNFFPEVKAFEKLCLTCELLKSIYDKYLWNFQFGSTKKYTEAEQKALDFLFQFMSDSMKNIFSRIFDGDGHDNLRNRFGETDNHFGEIYTNMRMDLQLTGNITPTDNFQMQNYFLLFLNSLKECPQQIQMRLGRSFSDTTFSFVNLDSVPNTYLENYHAGEPHMFVKEEDDNSERNYYGSVNTLARNMKDPCSNGYSVYKWIPNENGRGLWMRHPDDKIE